MNGSDLPSRAVVALVACALATAACSDDSNARTWYLGPVEAGTLEAGAPPLDAPAPPQLAVLRPDVCPAAVLQGPYSAVRSAAALNSRLILASADGVQAWQLDALGCPAEKLETFGQGGQVAMQALSAAPLPGGRTLVASESGTVLLGSLGNVAGSCLDVDNPVKARWLAVDAEGQGVALLVRSPVDRLATDLAQPAACAASKLTLQPDAFVLLAMAPALSGDGFVAAEQSAASAPIALSRYSAAGTRTQTASWSSEHPGHLCSASGLLETPHGIVAADSTCRRVVVYDPVTLEPTAAAALDGTPRGLAYTGEGASVLVVTTVAGDGGSQATISLLDLRAD